MDQTKNPVWTAAWPTLLLIGFGLACGGGATFGENSPGNGAYGGGTYLDDAYVPEDAPMGTVENGSLAIDPDTEYAYTMQVQNTDEGSVKRLVVIPPGEDARVVMDLTGYEDIRIIFPPDEVLVMAQIDPYHESLERGECIRPAGVNDDNRVRTCPDELFWFDKAARTKLRSLETMARYHGTRLSPKRNYLAVLDNFQDGNNIHLVDTKTGEANVVPNAPGWFEGMWLRGEDRLITAGFIEATEDTRPHLRLREWSPRADHEEAQLGNSTCFYDEAAGAPQTGCDVMIPGIRAMHTTGFSWIGISPDNRWVAVPARRDDDRAVVVLVDRERQELHMLDDTYGPVGFTPDSRTMIGFGFDSRAEPEDTDAIVLFPDPGDDPYLALVDLDTMETTHQVTPGDDAPTFFVSHDSSDVVVANVGTGESLMIVDLEAGESERMPGPRVAQRGRLFELDNDYSIDRRRMTASNLSQELSIMGRVDPCDDRVCEADEGLEVGLGEFVSRRGKQELWLLESAGLVRIDLRGGYSEVVPLDPPARRINIQPDRDRLVLDTRGEMAIRFYDPARRRVEVETSISLGWGL